MINIGRIVPEKGIKIAISVAKKLKIPLYLIGGAVEKDNFWQKDIKPCIDNNLIYHTFYKWKKITKILPKHQTLSLPHPMGGTLWVGDD